MRVGAGLSTVATARSALSTVAGFHPELMTEPLEETEAGTISRKAMDSVIALVERKSVLAIGPGISRHSETAEFVRAVVQNLNTPMVLDADALPAGAVKEARLRASFDEGVPSVAGSRVQALDLRTADFWIDQHCGLAPSKKT